MKVEYVLSFIVGAIFLLVVEVVVFFATGVEYVVGSNTFLVHPDPAAYQALRENQSQVLELKLAADKADALAAALAAWNAKIEAAKQDAAKQKELNSVQPVAPAAVPAPATSPLPATPGKDAPKDSSTTPKDTTKTSKETSQLSTPFYTWPSPALSPWQAAPAVSAPAPAPAPKLTEAKESKDVSKVPAAPAAPTAAPASLPEKTEKAKRPTETSIPASAPAEATPLPQAKPTPTAATPAPQEIAIPVNFKVVSP